MTFKSEKEALNYLKDKGFVHHPNDWIMKPTQDYILSESELCAIKYLIDEYGYGYGHPPTILSGD